MPDPVVPSSPVPDELIRRAIEWLESSLSPSADGIATGLRACLPPPEMEPTEQAIDAWADLACYDRPETRLALARRDLEKLHAAGLLRDDAMRPAP